MSWRRGQTAILTPSSSNHSSTSSSYWLGCSTVGHWGPKALRLPLALTPASCLQLTQTAPGHLVILLSPVRLLPLFFRLFTQVHLLNDGSVEGQSITIIEFFFYQNSTSGIFLHACLHLPHTQILQIMLKDNNSKNTKRNYLNNSKLKKNLN